MAGLDAVLDRSAVAGRALASASRTTRANLLDDIAAGLEEAGATLVPLAAEETRLATARLQVELRRTVYQVGVFATLIRDAAAFEPVLDPADPDHPVAPKPDLRSLLHPLGPVLVYAAGNFPFAFSVAGGDSVSALAAGCPVVVKVHEGHPRLSASVAELVRGAARRHGLPDDILQTVSTRDEGVAVLRDDRIQAVSFTGSEAGGRALFDIAMARRRPIPFYGELGSVNPIFVFPAAASRR
ncbi:MAG: aldehyde dehydrogenase family protein, partial [Phycicoccus sp.]